MSGILLNEDIEWITFHGQYDFAYLMKVVLGDNLDSKYEDFDEKLKNYFPNKYDIKEIISEREELKNYSLQKLGNEYNIERTGQQHQGGSDALLTLGICFNTQNYSTKLKKIFQITKYQAILKTRYLELELSTIPIQL